MHFLSTIIYLIIIYPLIFQPPNLLAQESLPPLPDLFDIRLKWTLPHEQLYSKDSAKISLLGGFYPTYSSPQFGYLISTHAAIPLSFANKFFFLAGGYSSDIDYNKYQVYSGQIISIIPIRVSLLSSELSVYRENRFSTFYENVKASASLLSPIFLGELNPRFSLRYARLFHNSNHDFFGLKFGNDYIIPSAIGDFNLATTIFLQSNVSTNWLIKLSDNIILKDFIFVKPNINWSLFDRTFGIGADIGLRIDKVISILQIIINEKQIINFDSLYADAGPIQINKELHYPNNIWTANLTFHFHNNEMDLGIRSFDYLITYRQADSLFYPENSPKRSTSIILNLKNELKLIENRFSCEYNTGELSLIPIFHLSEQLTIKVKRFSFSLAAEIIGKRHYENDKLGPNMVFDTDITYHQSFIEFKIGCKNIFRADRVFYPGFIDKHRKFLFEILMLKNL